MTRLHIVPHLGDVRLDQLTPAKLREWITLLLAKPRAQPRRPRAGEPAPEAARLSPRTVTLVHAVLRAALNDGLRDEVPGLRRNTAELVSPPVKAASSARPLDPRWTLPPWLRSSRQWRPTAGGPCG